MPLQLPPNHLAIPGDKRFIAYHATEAPAGFLFNFDEFNFPLRIKDGWVDDPCKLGVSIAQSVFGEQVAAKASRIHTAFRDGRLPAFEETPAEMEEMREKALQTQDENERLREALKMQEETHKRETTEIFERLQTAKEEDMDLTLDALKETYLGPGQGVSLAAQRERARQQAEAERAAAAQGNTGSTQDQ